MTTFEIIENIRADRDVKACQEELYSRVRGNLLPRLVHSIPARVQSRLEPEDVLNETFLRVLGALDLFHASDEKAFYAWVYRIARNYIADQAKRRSALALHFGTSEEQGPRPSSVQARETRVESRLRRLECIENVFSKLRTGDADIIRLRGLMGLSFDQIASRLKKTPAAVRRAYARAWRKFCSLARGLG